MQPRRIPEVVLGIYVAWLVLPAIGLAVPRTVATDGRLAALAGAGVAVALVVALAARATTDLTDRLATLPAAVLTVGPPLAYLPILVVLTPPRSTAGLLALTGLLAVLPGIALPVAGAILRNRRLRADATVVASVTVGDADDEGRDWPLVGGVLVMGVALVAAGVGVLLGADAEAGVLGPTFGGLWTSIALLASDDGSEIAVTDTGLTIDGSVTRGADLDGYRVTDDSIELVRDRWYRPDRSFDRDAVSDEDEFLVGLDRYLPRRYGS